MERLLPPEISSRLNLSLKTVYNYLTKYKGQIEIKKSEWKTFVNFESFQNVIQTPLQTDTRPFTIQDTKSNQNQGFENIVNLQKQLQTLQTDFERVSDEKTSLEKYNNNLTDQINKFALALSDERKEKGDLLKRHEELQDKYNAKIEEFSKERNGYIRKISTLWWLLLALVLVIISYVLFYIYFPAK